MNENDPGEHYHVVTGRTPPRPFPAMFLNLGASGRPHRFSCRTAHFCPLEITVFKDPASPLRKDTTRCRLPSDFFIRCLWPRAAGVSHARRSPLGLAERQKNSISNANGLCWAKSPTIGSGR